MFVVAWTCLALFLLKVTGFIAAGLICFFAFVAGRISLRAALASVALFLLALLTLDVTLGIVRAYVFDIWLLVRLNEGNLLSRFLQASSLHFGILAPAAGLAVALYLLKAGDAPLHADFRLPRSSMPLGRSSTATVSGSPLPFLPACFSRRRIRAGKHSFSFGLSCSRSCWKQTGSAAVRCSLSCLS